MSKKKWKVYAEIFMCNLNTGMIKHRRTKRKYEYMLEKYETPSLDNTQSTWIMKNQMKPICN